MVRFKLTDGCDDQRIYEHQITGRMTKLRYKIINRYSRKSTWYQSCGHEYDCCGCVCSQRVNLIYDGIWKLIKVQNLNY